MWDNHGPYRECRGIEEVVPAVMEILRDAVASWKADDAAMVVLLSGEKAPKGVGKLTESAKED